MRLRRGSGAVGRGADLSGEDGDRIEGLGGRISPRTWGVYERSCREAQVREGLSCLSRNPGEGTSSYAVKSSPSPPDVLITWGPSGGPPTRLRLRSLEPVSPAKRSVSPSLSTRRPAMNVLVVCGERVAGNTSPPSGYRSRGAF